MLRSKCATLVSGGGGNVSWGRLALVFPGFARFAHVVDWRFFRLSSENLAEKLAFCGTERFFGVITRKIVLSAECGVQIVSNLRQTFESPSFGGPGWNVVLSAEREKLIRSPCGFSKVFQKFGPNRPFCGGKRLKSWYGAPKKVPLIRSPPYLHLFLGFRISRVFNVPIFLFFGFWLRWEWNFKKKGPRISPLWYKKWGPVSTHQDIYIYVYIYTHIFLFGQGLAMDLPFGLFLSKTQGVFKFWGPNL